MNKMILLISICIIMVFSTIALVVVLANGNGLTGERDGVITQKETAIKIGRALLEEHFSDTFLNSEIVIDAEEKGGIWKVYNVLERERKTEEGKIMIIKGGELYVEFSKNNGEVLKIGIND